MATYEPIETHRKLVRALAERFLDDEDIVTLLEQMDGTVIDVETLTAVYAHELRMGRAKSRYAIVEGLHKLAARDNVTILIYLSKVHLGWTEQQPAKKSTAKSGEGEEEKSSATRLPKAAEMGKILRIPARSSRRSSGSRTSD